MLASSSSCCSASSTSRRLIFTRRSFASPSGGPQRSFTPRDVAFPSCAPVPARSVLRVSGSDAQRFLNGLAAVRIPDLTEESRAFYAAFLHAQVGSSPSCCCSFKREVCARPDVAHRLTPPVLARLALDAGSTPPRHLHLSPFGLPLLPDRPPLGPLASIDRPAPPDPPKAVRAPLQGRRPRRFGRVDDVGGVGA